MFFKKLKDKIFNKKRELPSQGYLVGRLSGITNFNEAFKYIEILIKEYNQDPLENFKFFCEICRKNHKDPRKQLNIDKFLKRVLKKNELSLYFRVFLEYLPRDISALFKYAEANNKLEELLSALKRDNRKELYLFLKDIERKCLDYPEDEAVLAFLTAHYYHRFASKIGSDLYERLKLEFKKGIIDSILFLSSYFKEDINKLIKESKFNESFYSLSLRRIIDFIKKIDKNILKESNFEAEKIKELSLISSFDFEKSDFPEIIFLLKNLDRKKRKFYEEKLLSSQKFSFLDQDRLRKLLRYLKSQGLFEEYSFFELEERIEDLIYESAELNYTQVLEYGSDTFLNFLNRYPDQIESFFRDFSSNFELYEDFLPTISSAILKKEDFNLFLKIKELLGLPLLLKNVHEESAEYLTLLKFIEKLPREEKTLVEFSFDHFERLLQFHKLDSNLRSLLHNIRELFPESKVSRAKSYEYFKKGLIDYANPEVEFSEKEISEYLNQGFSKESLRMHPSGIRFLEKLSSITKEDDEISFILESEDLNNSQKAAFILKLLKDQKISSITKIEFQGEKRSLAEIALLLKRDRILSELQISYYTFDELKKCLKLAAELDLPEGFALLTNSNYNFSDFFNSEEGKKIKAYSLHKRYDILFYLLKHKLEIPNKHFEKINEEMSLFILDIEASNLNIMLKDFEHLQEQKIFYNFIIARFIDDRAALETIQSRIEKNDIKIDYEFLLNSVEYRVDKFINFAGIEKAEERLKSIFTPEYQKTLLKAFLKKDLTEKEKKYIKELPESLKEILENFEYKPLKIEKKEEEKVDLDKLKEKFVGKKEDEKIPDSIFKEEMKKALKKSSSRPFLKRIK